jgi:hypothetical protein
VLVAQQPGPGTLCAMRRDTFAPPSETKRFDRKRWLERGLLLLSLAGWPLTRLVAARWGRRGGLVVEGVSLLLLGRVLQLIIGGAPGKLRALPRWLVYVELATDALALATGLPASIGSARLAPLNNLAVASMFLIHSVRFAIYLSPGGQATSPCAARRSDPVGMRGARGRRRRTCPSQPRPQTTARSPTRAARAPNRSASGTPRRRWSQSKCR